MSWEYIGWNKSAMSREFKGEAMGDENEKNEKNRRLIGVLRIVIVVLAIILVAIVIAFAVHSVQLQAKLEAVPGPCPSGPSNINLDPPEVLPPFHDLTRKEIMSIKDFLYSQKDLNLVKPSEIAVNTSYIYTIELLVPNKQVTLDHLDRGRAPPEREARVWIFRGDRPETFIEEYTIGPLPNPVYKKDQATFPFRYRPLTSPEIGGAIAMLHMEIGGKISKILLESYGGRLGTCDNDCLDFEMISPMSAVSSGSPRTRKMWFWLTPTVEYFSLNPIDFLVLVDLTSNNVDEYSIDRLHYGGEMFRTLDALLEAYEQGSVIKTKIPYPTNDKNLHSSMHRRGRLFPEEPLNPPQTYEPDGRRYSINGRHVEYMGWEFDVRMSTMSGPQLFDIKFDNKRIVYELSLQEIAVFYSANSPGIRFADYVDSVALIGARARSLVPGGDCPGHSTFLSATHVVETSDDPLVVDRAFCVFEHNTGVPLRRHLSSSGAKNKFYEGMMDTVLTVRTITTVVNYDYIFDFIFHQNGAVEVKAISTGYILTSFRFPAEDEYGFRIKDHVTGNLHHHMFNFKVDIDINGRKNRFEAIEINQTAADNTLWSAESGARYFQTKMIRRQLKRESEATIDYNFDAPKYLTFYNMDVKTPSGVPRAYRLLMRGMSKQMFQKGKGQEPSVSWARHQLAVTKLKDSERRSSSMYAIWDAEDPVVNFQKFIDDDEILTDQDQVAWVTMGVQHIPHTEDMPVTPTVGLDLRFFLLPYNYFDEDPAMGSADAIRIEPRDQKQVSSGVKLERYGQEENFQCMPREKTFSRDIQDKPSSLFDQPSGDAYI